MKYINVAYAGAEERIVVIGSGFAGLNFAGKLSRVYQYQIVLIDTHNFH